MRNLQLVHHGKLLREGADWTQLSGGRFTLSFRTFVGAPFRLLDTGRASDFDGIVARADGQGEGGDNIPVGVELRIVAASVIGVDDAKRERVRVVDTRTNEIIDAGFEFPPASGVLFSLSMQAQSKLNGAFIARDEPEFVYPLEWNNIDDTTTVAIADASTLRLFYLQAVGTVKAVLESGTDLKKAINVATTIEEVEAVVDPR